MKTSELCTMEEVRKGYNAHIIGFGILIYKNGNPWMQVVNEKEMHEMIKIDMEG
jgi:hypothetical protein